MKVFDEVEVGKIIKIKIIRNNMKIWRTKFSIHRPNL
jgi:hypothetical protein